MLELDHTSGLLHGSCGTLPVHGDDEVLRRLMMLIEGECEGLGAAQAATKYGMTRQRYYQIRDRFRQGGTPALQSGKRGPKTNYRRTSELVRQVIRHRFLDPDASPAVIRQKLVQSGLPISERSVARVIEDFGLQKKGSIVTGRSQPSNR